MKLHQTDKEIGLALAQRIRRYRISPNGAGMSQTELARRSGVGLTPLKRFEKTGGTSLNNLIALLRALNLLSGIENLIPEPDSPSPLQLLKASKSKLRQRAPRSPKKNLGPVRGRKPRG